MGQHIYVNGEWVYLRGKIQPKITTKFITEIKNLTELGIAEAMCVCVCLIHLQSNYVLI